MSKRNNRLLDDQLLKDWLLISRIVKNDRIVEKLPYTEALVLGLTMDSYPQYASLQTILKKSKMLKSQLNYVLKCLIDKQLIDKRVVDTDHRCQEIKLTELGVKTLEEIHQDSIQRSSLIISIIGEEDAKELIRIFEKIIDNEDLFVKDIEVKEG